VNKYNKEYYRGYIVDLFTAPGRIDVAYALLLDTLNHFEDLSVNIIQSWVIKGHPHETLFQSNGFIDSRQVFDICYTPININTKELRMHAFRSDQLHCQLGDVDWI